MPYIKVNELNRIDKFLTEQVCSNLMSPNTSEEEANRIVDEYTHILIIFMRLNNQQKKLNEYTKKYRAKNPEKAKEYARNYMREYNAEKRRRRIYEKEREEIIKRYAKD